MTHTRNRKRRSSRPMKAARNYWFWYTYHVRSYEAMMAAIACHSLYR